MQLVERHIQQQNKAIRDLCFRSARLHNFCNYHMRQVAFGKLQPFSEYELTGLLSEFDQEDYRRLNATVSQQVVKLVFQNWRAYKAALNVILFNEIFEYLIINVNKNET